MFTDEETYRSYLYSSYDLTSANNLFVSAEYTKPFGLSTQLTTALQLSDNLDVHKNRMPRLEASVSFSVDHTFNWYSM